MALVIVVLASITLDPVGILIWLLIGLVAGFLASKLVRGRGLGLMGDIVVGLLGALIGGFLANLVGFSLGGLLGTAIIAFLGACLLLLIIRALTGGGRKWRR
jgi:uncharacterized membrane protein YeaQ/YmgE (transglycosylase-associated protein family)